MKLTMDEKQILAAVSKPDPEKRAILKRLEDIQTSDFKTAKLVKGLHDKLATSDEQTVFIAVIASQAEEIEVEDLFYKDESEAMQKPTEYLLAEAAGGDPEQYREDLRKFGLAGFVKNIDSLDYPPETKKKILDLLNAIP